MSAFKKVTSCCWRSNDSFNNVFADEGHGIVKFKGEVILLHVLLNR